MTPRTLSLERKLPLLMTAVLVVVLAASLFLTYGTLTRSAESAAGDRLTRAARQVAGMVRTPALERAAQLRQLARDGALTGDTLVWRAGIARWTRAAEVAEVAELLRDAGGGRREAQG